MLVKCQTIITFIEEMAPKSLAMEGDNTGWQVGDPGRPVDHVLLALDVGEQTVAEAAELAAQLIISHHPLIYKPMRSIRFDLPLGRIVSGLIRSDIGVYSAHTNLDAAENGVNTALAQRLGLVEIGPLSPELEGFGRVGRLPEAVTFAQFIGMVKVALGIPGSRAGGPLSRRVSKVAICGGSGGDLWSKAAFAGADVYVTGDLKYHTAQEILNAGMNFIDPGHFASERVILDPLAEYLRERITKAKLDVKLSVSRTDSDPFVFR
ncbi:MAG: Nif3-like dinuclear metal center hexameric protein [Eubacteriales bacterium]|jgi:dinuclear metal center YbgI/SA1388 family protein|nr:Nif3-like dinuclear metal center hexameric protein [Bacillota bacterium]MBV1726809.1 Nif3-like dinuclear metal center hexameric protein [Desulforudis sp.]MDP3051517.1 Nif3-like dinuclear metal center hexameric protein [Eubacteriales bacterium]MBU4554153.1 Nif3-like dinuclear metal center hexameric protein [Bacillota bacterium]MBV1735792.1 Nif3-like dinuclear metal center hexameric protein [Desulforudis sp.]